jgi:hypothetical protein
MASTDKNPSDLEFLVNCIRRGEMKVDFAKVNADYGWNSRSKS